MSSLRSHRRGQEFESPILHSGHYTDLVEFRFGTGCRTGELVGLRWKHVSDNFSTIWIGETLVKGVRKATKTNRARFITMNPVEVAQLTGPDVKTLYEDYAGSVNSRPRLPEI